ncbi:MAG: hypothetical protein HOY71_46405 [Nonomuraea sp.]|nr:hypothetical protein [Nonomuraea sp.]
MNIRMSALVLGVLLAATTAAAPAAAVVQRPPGGGEECAYPPGHDPTEGVATCRNANPHAIEFRAVIGCDDDDIVMGDWVTVQAGKRGTSRGDCGVNINATSVGVDVRDL